MFRGRRRASRHRPRLALTASAHVGVGGEASVEELDRVLHARRAVDRAVHRRHAALAQPLHDPVAALEEDADACVGLGRRVHRRGHVRLGVLRLAELLLDELHDARLAPAPPSVKRICMFACVLAMHSPTILTSFMLTPILTIS